MTIDSINFDNLKGYAGKTTRSFEQMLYQLMLKEYGHWGKFTPIDGSGGDSGVEFFLDLPNGERWGWQCKFYSGNGRLKESNRVKSIEDSLITACRNHKNLTRWFLCLKTNLTIESQSPSGNLKNGERSWFETLLPQKIPSGRIIELNFIGEDELVGLLAKPDSIGIRSFFFGELEVNQEWFSKRFGQFFERVMEKYDPDLHTIDEFTQSIIDFALVDPGYLSLIDKTKANLNNIKAEFTDAAREFHKATRYNDNERSLHKAFTEKLMFVDELFHLAESNLAGLQTAFTEYPSAPFTNDVVPIASRFKEVIEKLNSVRFERGSLKNGADTVIGSIRSYIKAFEQFHRNYVHEKEAFKDLHFWANAAEGKTHLACDISYKRVERGLPVIFIPADKFNNEPNLEDAILKLMDIPRSYSFETFLETLDSFGMLAGTRIPIIVDGLNETVMGRHFSKIWETHLPELISKIHKFKNIVLITTCRTSYQKFIWGDTIRNTFFDINGFADLQVTRAAIEKYFEKYHLKADLNFAYLGKFRKPIFLKLYCEIKNPDWRSGVEVEVNVDEDSTEDIFEEYFVQFNKKVTRNSPILRPNQAFLKETLFKIGVYLWENDLREIPIDDFYILIDGSTPYELGKSKADILINEGLVITRDMRDDQEYVSITYELMAGSIIANSLIQKSDWAFFDRGGEFLSKISGHPLYENISDQLALLLPKRFGRKLHQICDLDEGGYVAYTAITSLWRLAPQYINNDDIALVKKLFDSSSKSKNFMFPLFRQVVSNTRSPFNADFFSELLVKLPVAERDLTWTEYVRYEFHNYKSFIEQFEEQCKLPVTSDILKAKLHLAAKHIQWILVSTNRKLRDLTTRALFYYGRRFPVEFADLAYASLSVNDPYLWERMLGALYGVCLTEHYVSKTFKEDVLPSIGKKIFQLIFQPGAPFFTTHAIAREYAKGCVAIALLFHPKLLKKPEQRLISPPYKAGKDIMFESHPDGEQSCGGPIRMDFGNYTIGYIVEDGHSYSNPPEKKKVRGQIYQRIYELGWNEVEFKEVDALVSDDFYQSNRSERATVERYGKKYSWIAFHEILGHRQDLGLLKEDWDDFRMTFVDIDVSFPEPVPSEKYITEELLGDSSISLVEWFKTPDYPAIDPYLEASFSENQWICLDGYLRQTNEELQRKRFTFIRSFLVNDSDFDSFLQYLKNQNLGGRWLGEKTSNYYAFANELYLIPEAKKSNLTQFTFHVNGRKKTVKRGDPEYFPLFETTEEESFMSIKEKHRKSFETTVWDEVNFENILQPVMDYNWESYHSELNTAGHTSILSHELVAALDLIKSPQLFEFYDQNGKLASTIKNYYGNFTNSHHMLYIRRDLFDKYLKDNKLRFVWAIWGEREVKFDFDIFPINQFYQQNNIDGPAVFQKIIDYNNNTNEF